MNDGRVQLVDEAGRTIGWAPKLDAHRGEGRLHRAVSVVLLRSDGQVLLQRRSARKYHFGDLWANSCCTHPYGSESPERAAARALRDELGVRCPIWPSGVIRYRASDPRSGLVEHEYDHVFWGRWEGEVDPREEEVQDVAWFTPAEVDELVAARPSSVAPWLDPVLRAVCRRSRTP